MSTGSVLLDLALVFGQLGLMSVGGVIAILPEVQRQVVEVHHWMDAREFTTLFALAQAAPGPNTLVVSLVGWRVAGLGGVVVATTALVAPPAVLAYAVARIWHRFRSVPFLGRVQAGLSSVTVGLFASAAVIVAQAGAPTWPLAAMTTVTAGVLVATRLNPLWLLAAGAALGALGVQ